mmetsp:Transcript_7495/g.12220  ORF Transcript_7495/g.12220 Transcript_7495/m.12220 type:complete len:90 (-) Transcript_7495:35-304(-)
MSEYFLQLFDACFSSLAFETRFMRLSFGPCPVTWGLSLRVLRSVLLVIWDFIKVFRRIRLNMERCVKALSIFVCTACGFGKIESLGVCA